MNSTISLRPAHPGTGYVPNAKRDALPPSQHELASPVRQAILCARQHLLAAEYADGTWLGARPCDTATASQLILLQLFCGQELDDRTEDLSQTILRRQLHSGGWATSGDGTMDLDTSIQAYLALKLIGTDAAEMPLRVARTAILTAGGADQCGNSTRMLLAMFGQIDFDACAAAPPEMLPLASRGGTIAMDLIVSLLWSHRVVRKVGARQGIQELFCTAPRSWQRNSSLAQRGLLWLERRGWIPLRRWALDRAESQLQDWTQETTIAKASLSEIVWMTMALHALGHTGEATQMAACWNSIDERIHHSQGEITVLGTPTDRRHDTAQSLRAVIASGGETKTVKGDHATTNPALDSVDPLTAAAELLALQMLRDGCPDAEGLPPAMKVVEESEAYFTFGIADCDDPSDQFNSQGDQLAAACRRLQNRDGGWAIRDVSDANTTSRVLQALAAWDAKQFQSAISRGADYLCHVQAANGSLPGSWHGTDSIQTTSLAVRALVAIGRSADDFVVTSALNWLAVHQQADGGWQSGNASEPDNCFNDSSTTCTAAVVAAHLDAGQQHSETAARGIEFLVAAQDNTGGWQVAWPSIGDDNRPTDSLAPVCAALETLSQWAVQCNAEESEPPMFLQLVGAEE